MMTSPLTSQLMRAVLARFEAERQVAAATRQLADAEEALETLNKNFLSQTQQETEADAPEA